MKKIIEIKRGDIVPENAKWLTSKTVIVKEWEEQTGHELQRNGGYEVFREYAQYDVFEVLVEALKEVDEKLQVK
ncbi:MAG: hypothetical protein RL463_381 [Bacteroidota bacterium]|jgi:hypothetical protein